MKKRLLLPLLFVFCFLAVSAQGLTDKYLSIRDKLTDLKSQSELVTEQLILVSENLRTSQQEALEWEQTSMQLSESLTTINEQLNDCYVTIEKQKARLNLLIKLLVSCIGFFVVLGIIKVVFIVFYVKGIPVPRIVDILA